jgi:hypothetical protein
MMEGSTREYVMWLVSTMYVGRGRERQCEIRRNATIGMGMGGIPVTPVYEDMHANNDIRREKKN